jgi:hypothetical protein
MVWRCTVAAIGVIVDPFSITAASGAILQGLLLLINKLTIRASLTLISKEKGKFNSKM